MLNIHCIAFITGLDMWTLDEHAKYSDNILKLGWVVNRSIFLGMYRVE